MAENSTTTTASKGKEESFETKQFNRWTIIKIVSSGKHPRALAKCQCGTEKEVDVGSIVRETSKSCGCLQSELAAASHTTHGLTKHPIHGVWNAMKTRCGSPNCRNYHRYGGRGIKVCERWLQFENFAEDMLPTYQPGLTLDRRDNNGNYCKENCKWETKKTQNNNRCDNRMVECNGEIMTLPQLAEAAGVSRRAIEHRWYRDQVLIRQTEQPRYANAVRLGDRHSISTLSQS